MVCSLRFCAHMTTRLLVQTQSLGASGHTSTRAHCDVITCVTVFAESFASLLLLVSRLFLVPPHGEVTALEGEVDHLHRRDCRRAHPQPDAAAEIRDKLRLLQYTAVTTFYEYCEHMYSQKVWKL